MKKPYLHLVFLFLVLCIAHLHATTCNCDLTAHGCDINCCCDLDCTVEEKKVFNKCIKLNNEHISEICVSDSVLFSANGKYQIEGTGSGLLCLYKNNYNARFFYSDVIAVKDQAAFEHLASKYHKTEYSVDMQAEKAYKKSFEVGDPMFISVATSQQGVQIPGFLPQPLSFLTNECEDSNPARFLHAEKSECFRLVRNVKEQCGNELSWNPASYTNGYAVAPYPSFIFGEKHFVEVTNSTGTLNETTTQVMNDSQLITPQLHKIKCLDADGGFVTCPFATPPLRATLDDNNTTCVNVVHQVTYNIIYKTNDIVEISKVNVIITLANISTSFLQSSLFTFEAETNTTANRSTEYKRSGNPGYITGLPVIVAVVEGTTVYPSYLNSTVHWSTIKVNSDGVCNADAGRESISFGFDLKTGCFVTVEKEMTLAKCQQLQKDIYRVLLKDLPTHVAMFGNPDHEKIADWIHIINVKPISRVSVSKGLCSNMHTSVVFEFLFTRSGFLKNPQKKIVGARLKYSKAQDLLWKCFGLFCDASKKETIEIVQSVSFVDVSLIPEAEVKSKPQFKSKAPHNFFYPFFT